MTTYETVTEALQELYKRGFELNLNIAFDKDISQEKHLNPEDFEIIETYRFEGDTNPSDEDVVYALISKDGYLKGVFSGAFGTYNNADENEILHLLSNHK